MIKKFEEFINEHHSFWDDVEAELTKKETEDINKETKYISTNIFNALKHYHFDKYFDGEFEYATLKEYEFPDCYMKDNVDINNRLCYCLVTKLLVESGWKSELQFDNTLGFDEYFQKNGKPPYADVERLEVHYDPNNEYGFGDLSLCIITTDDEYSATDEYNLCYNIKEDSWKWVFLDIRDLSNDELSKQVSELVSIISIAVNSNTKYQKNWFKNNL